MKYAVLDIETTGGNFNEEGITEIAIHLFDGRHVIDSFISLINPEKEIQPFVVQLTGINNRMLRNAPKFHEVAKRIVEITEGAILVAHNASFDRGFLNAELKRCGRPEIPEIRWVDTVQIARKRFPGAPASLDALCKRFDISLESRTFHGALLDAQLLAGVYLELLGGRARAFEFDGPKAEAGQARAPAKPRPKALPPRLTSAEREAHASHLDALGDHAVWKTYLGAGDTA